MIKRLDVFLKEQLEQLRITCHDKLNVHIEDIEMEDGYYEDDKPYQLKNKTKKNQKYTPPPQPDPLSSQWPRPTRYFGDRSNPCVNDCRKGSEYLNFEDNLDEDEEKLEAL